MTNIDHDAELRAAATTSKAWPYEEARKLLKRYPQGKPGSAPMLSVPAFRFWKVSPL